MRTIGVVTTGRADYSSYLPLLRAIHEEPELDLRLLVSGMHLSPEFGLTVRQIEKDGFPIAERVETLLSSDTPEATAKSMGLGVMGFADVFRRDRPDILVVLGDRFEMCAVPFAALPFRIPVAHISGGELTEGAIDDVLRHCITKLSHLHFTATEEYAQRVIQLGEEPWRVIASGEPSLDALRTMNLLSRSELTSRLNLPAAAPFLLVTYHPVTLEPEDSDRQIDALLQALHETGTAAVFTQPNADPYGRGIARHIEEAVKAHLTWRLVPNFGPRDYFSAMSHAAAMVGNSSSGIIEAASLELPVVNIGTRQQGRVRARNVIDVGYGRREILSGIERTLRPDFRESLRGLENPYGRGHAVPIIVERLKTIELGDKLVRKRFHNLPPSGDENER
jgi:UDP-hydrolysing UDP-N-acetyl-D-glucosamine 2-epimerase